ncbi:hypothetical protein, partial [Nocardia sp. JMUB6875]|uniref:hypothetical protein n=1 Tax=Nocardia sp. JMUB6875 TaxID=3158170 RepID=UPI0034E8A8CC
IHDTCQNAATTPTQAPPNPNDFATDVNIPSFGYPVGTGQSSTNTITPKCGNATAHAITAIIAATPIDDAVKNA